VQARGGVKGDSVAGEASSRGRWWWLRGERMFQGLELCWCRKEGAAMKEGFSFNYDFVCLRE